jgi:thiol-disulfide isomerase/thioredoxin
VRALAGAVAALLLLTACSGGSSAASGKSLNGDFEKLAGGQTSFENYRGRPVVVNFFSSTCIPCQTEMPALEKTKQQLGDQVAFIGMDVTDSAETGRAFAASTGVTWDLGRDPDASIMQGLGGIYLPTTAIADGTGKVVWMHTGAVNVDDVTTQLREHHLIR